MTERYDVVVVGAGSAGLSAAGFAAQLGSRVAIVERDRVGGDCTWSGCVPSKALLHAARLAQKMRGAGTFGLGVADGPIDLGRVLGSVQATVERVAALESPEILAEDGIELVCGAARFVDAHNVDVAGRTLSGRRFIVCTGAEPVIPPIPGLVQTPHLTYQDVFQLRTLPARLLVLGAGPVGVELAQAFQRLGTEVTVFEQEDRILPVADPDASVVLAAQLRDEGMRLLTRARIEGVEGRDGRVSVEVGGVSYGADALLIAGGRHPRVQGLGLEEAGVAFNPKGIVVDARLRTSQRHIYACGDVTGSWQFTHYAAWQGFMAARNALLPGASRGQRPAPWAVFTDPEVAQVGLTEKEARARWSNVGVEVWPGERIDRAQTAGESRGFLKLVSRANGTLVGATVVGTAAGEVANELALALDHGLRLQDLAQSIHIYPTYGSAIQQASAAAAVRRLTAGWQGRFLRTLVKRWPR